MKIIAFILAVLASPIAFGAVEWTASVKVGNGKLLTKPMGPGNEPVYGFEKHACVVTSPKVEDSTKEWRMISCMDRATGFSTGVMVVCTPLGGFGELWAGEKGGEMVLIGLRCSRK